ncbi:MAG TPA: hypothetical protein VLV83_08845 [Acidobacteriota bacterium]|nr:hypothetical protein [Acidobacteriota bacterium]
MSIKSTVPGIKAQHAVITPTCRAGRGDAGAFEEAVRRLRQEYEACCKPECNAQANFHLVLTVERND